MIGMLPFVLKFPEIGEAETRVITAFKDTNIPKGEYGLVELYCEDPECDCRRVMIIVMSKNPTKTWATINYGWESIDFYNQWFSGDAPSGMSGAELDPLNTQSEYALEFLKIFYEIIKDENYVERLKRHYAMFKGTTSKPQKRDGQKRRIRRKKKRRK
jgi:hypothetical protein